MVQWINSRPDSGSISVGRRENWEKLEMDAVEGVPWLHKTHPLIDPILTFAKKCLEFRLSVSLDRQLLTSAEMRYVSTT